MTPLFSVYIPCHDYGKYLATAIKSVLNQTFEDFELILIDDASSDGSREIIAEFEELDDRIRSFRTETHWGLIKCANFAFSNAKGKFVIRLDADDWLQTFALEEFSFMITRFPQAQILYSDMLQMDRIGGNITLYDSLGSVFSGRGLNGAGVAIDRNYFISVGLYDEEFDCSDGLLLNLKCRTAPTVKIDRPLYIYYRHPTSLTADRTHVEKTRAAMRAKYPQPW